MCADLSLAAGRPVPLLKARDLSRHVGERALWQHVSMDLFAGERLMVVGPSGSGKSLLLRVLAGLDPLESGEISFLNKCQSQWDLPQYRAQVMLLMQRPVLSGGSVAQMLRYPFGFRVHQRRIWEESAAVQLFRQLGRDADFLNAEAQHLSGGEGQLVALVRALLLSPQILLLDEATSALDPETIRRFEEVLIAWSREGQRAIAAVSHDPAQRRRLGTRAFSVTGATIPL